MEIKKLPFYDFLLQAWQVSISPRKKMLMLGLIVSVSNIATSRLDIVFPYIISWNKFVLILPAKIYSEAFLVFIWLALFFLIGAFGKGNLILSLAYIAGKSGLSNYPNNFAALKKNFFRTAAIDVTAFFSMIAAIIIILLPLGVASAKNPNVINLLMILGIITLVPIIIVIFFIRQYSLFYFLLSPVSFRGSIETACALFSKFFRNSLLFGLFFVLLTAIFTFCLQFIISGIVFMADKIAFPLDEQLVSLVVSLVYFAWFAIFQQALWLAFFKSIAGTHEIAEAVSEKKQETTITGVPEIPPVKNFKNEINMDN